MYRNEKKKLTDNRDSKYIDNKRAICACDRSSASDLIVTTISLQGRRLLLLFTKCNSRCSLQKRIFILSAANTVIRELSVYL